MPCCATLLMLQTIEAVKKDELKLTISWVLKWCKNLGIGIGLSFGITSICKQYCHNQQGSNYRQQKEHLLSEGGNQPANGSKQ